jgi:hypothetical protein
VDSSTQAAKFLESKFKGRKRSRHSSTIQGSMVHAVGQPRGRSQAPTPTCTNDVSSSALERPGAFSSAGASQHHHDTGCLDLVRSVLTIPRPSDGAAACLRSATFSSVYIHGSRPHDLALASFFASLLASPSTPLAVLPRQAPAPRTATP